MADEETRIYVIGPDEGGAVLGRLNDLGIIPHTALNLVEARWYDEILMCGCGNPEQVRAYIAGILKAMNARFRDNQPPEIIDAAINKPDMANLFIRYALDAMGLTEHGGSVYGSWVSPKGEEWLKEWEAADEDLS